MSDQKLRDMFDEIVPLLDQVRIMYRFMDVIGEYKECIPVHPQLWGEFRDMFTTSLRRTPGAWRRSLLNCWKRNPTRFPTALSRRRALTDPDPMDKSALPMDTRGHSYRRKPLQW
jgi:hypothetical protein